MITIRKMTPADLTSIDDVQRVSFAPELREDMSLFEGILETYSDLSFVAEKSGALAGYLLAHPTSIERDDFEMGCEDLSGNEEYIYIHDLCIHPDHRRTGLALQLFNTLEKSAKEKGFDKLCGIAVQDSEGFWLKQGFEVILPYSYHGVPGTLMVKTLAPVK